MLTTIEQKLSAIKAINEAKDRIEDNLSTCSFLEQLPQGISINFMANEGVTSVRFEQMPMDLKLKILGLVKDHLEREKKELIEKATVLINS